MYFLNDMVEERLTKSKTDKLDPSRAIPYTEQVDPNRKYDRREQVDPR
jgi:hypothetical protein